MYFKLKNRNVCIKDEIDETDNLFDHNNDTESFKLNDSEYEKALETLGKHNKIVKDYSKV